MENERTGAARFIEVLASALASVSVAAKTWSDEEHQASLAPQPAKPSDYLSPAQVAAQTGDSRGAITEWCQRGRIRAEKHGRRWRIPAAEVEKFLARARAKAHVLAKTH